MPLRRDNYRFGQKPSMMTDPGNCRFPPTADLMSPRPGHRANLSRRCIANDAQLRQLIAPVDIAQVVRRFMLSSKKDWQCELCSPPCAGKAAHHIFAPQFLDAGLGYQTVQLRIVEMDYGLPRFS